MGHLPGRRDFIPSNSVTDLWPEVAVLEKDSRPALKVLNALESF